MWHEKQENVILPGQATCSPKILPGATMENKILISTSGNNDINFVGVSSRKRKLTAVELPCAKFENCSSWESNGQQINSFSRINLRGNTHDACLNQSKSVEPVTVWHEFVNDQFHYRNDLPRTWPTVDGNFNRTGIEKVSNVSLSVLSQSSVRKGSFPLDKIPFGQDLTVQNQQSQMCDMYGQTEAHGLLPLVKSCDAYTEKALSGPALQDVVPSGIRNHVVTNEMPREMCNASSEHLRPLEVSQQNFLQSNKFPGCSDGRTCSQEANKLKFSSEFEQNGNYLNKERIDNLPTVLTASSGALVCTDQNGNHRFLQKEEQFGSVHLDSCVGDNFESEVRDLGGGGIKINNKTEASDTKNLKDSLSEDFSFENRGRTANGHDRKNDPSHGSLKLSEKGKLPSGRAASTVAEKLWDGSLQLNSSITVSAVAFFKSGEKLLDINWSELVEVKGKVRLEAFEKYIQDLPRSRNRGLMVISLCWKEGSAETGLTGMKEVAKAYRKGERVGFAQLSQGIDLYICPRSDTIITILAKYGFFKGMAAVEDNQDSLIGCVVWRRNRASSNSLKKLESNHNSLSELPLDSPSDPSMQQAAEKNFSPTQPAQEFIQHASITSSKTLESAEKNGKSSKNIELGEVQIEVHNSSSGASSLPTPSVLGDLSSIPVGLRTTPHSYSPSLQGSHGCLLEVEASCTHHSGTEQPKTSPELQKPAIPLPSDVTEQMVLTFDDDDLPEFDFRTACGISPAPIGQPLDAVKLDKRLPAEENKNMDGSMQPILQAISSSNQRSDNSSLSRIRKACEHESQIQVYHKLEEKHSFQSKATPSPVSSLAFASPKNPFDEMPRKHLFDDDDMPEWCPLDLPNQSYAKTRKPSTICLSELPNSIFRDLPSGLPQPPLPSLSLAAIHSPLSSQASPSALHSSFPRTLRRPQPAPFECGPTPSIGSNYIPVLRPQTNSFGVGLPFRPSDGRGWKP